MSIRIPEAEKTMNGPEAIAWCVTNPNKSLRADNGFEIMFRSDNAYMVYRTSSHDAWQAATSEPFQHEWKHKSCFLTWEQLPTRITDYEGEEYYRNWQHAICRQIRGLHNILEAAQCVLEEDDTASRDKLRRAIYKLLKLETMPDDPDDVGDNKHNNNEHAGDVDAGVDTEEEDLAPPEVDLTNVPNTDPTVDQVLGGELEEAHGD